MIDAGREGGSTAGITLLHDRESIPDETRSYAALLSKARAYAHHFTAMGLEPGDRVLIVLPTSFEYVLVFFAVQLAGAIPVPVYPPATLERADVAHDRLTHVARHSAAPLPRHGTDRHAPLRSVLAAPATRSTNVPRGRGADDFIHAPSLLLLGARDTVMPKRSRQPGALVQGPPAGFQRTSRYGRSLGKAYSELRMSTRSAPVGSSVKP